ncbi:hypothetical protein D3OALGA1CA_1972 [Olavius algarvensis associated proteobacterium Delta 3]|nr:hypothetical protein D3OALGA1CA_1972 [Olavius algarvensis associated proteobacterium Delta 3]CAB5119058.1 hypothetical protein D3OALGB2SA_2865 [Olavius algarvensis associated proteobacterium Delta 3]
MYTRVQWSPIPRISHQTLILCRNLMIAKGYYVKQANFDNYAKIKRILEMESLHTRLRSF